MKIVLDFETVSAYSFFTELKIKKSTEEITKLITEHGSDYELIQDFLDEKYPEDKYFVLLDFIPVQQGYFIVRVWEK